MNHPVAWAAPQPYWRPGPASAHSRAALAQPQILRFASDEFMEELMATLETEPAQLPQYTAQPETWREPHVGPVPAPEQWVERKPARLLPLIRKAKAKNTLPVLVPKVMLPEKPLKLYQPAHQRHYLVAGSLICQAPGLPDRAIDPARQRVAFVVRRLFPKVPVDRKLPLPQPTALSDWEEHAWVLVGKSGEWRRVGNAALEAEVALPLAGEERLAMFPSKYVEPRGQPRRLFVGSVPVGRREAYQGGEQRSTPRSADELSQQAKRVQFQTDVLGPWRAMVNIARDLKGLEPLSVFESGAFNDDGTLKCGVQRTPLLEQDADKPRLAALRSQLQLSAWYLLLDLRNYLKRYLGDYLEWIDGIAGSALPDGLAAFDNALRRVVTPTGLSTGSLNMLQAGFTAAKVAPNLPDALKRIGAFESRLDNALSGQTGFAATPFDLNLDGAAALALWPDFLFLFVDPVYEVPAPTNFTDPLQADDFPSEKLQQQIDALAALLPLALLSTDTSPPEPTLASMQPADMREAWYVMRLVYERPDCAPFEGPVTSRATAPFQMAGFFDPDAPARPIRIGLPVDISPAGLRKFDKNAVFMMSDMLCGHVDRFKGMTFGDLVLSVLPWPFHKDLKVPDKGPCKQGELSLGVMCSLSIPIITICALILLMIIVALLDLIFRWLPLFVVCFPLPGFKGKK